MNVGAEISWMVWVEARGLEREKSEARGADSGASGGEESCGTPYPEPWAEPLAGLEWGFGCCGGWGWLEPRGRRRSKSDFIPVVVVVVVSQQRVVTET